MANDDRALLGSENVSSLRQARTGGLRQENYRDTLHYYEDYGMTLNEDVYKGAKEKEEAYNESVENANKALASGYSELEGGYKESLSKLPDVPTWEDYRTKNLKQIRITDESGTNIEQTYWLPSNIIQEIVASEEFKKNYPYAIFEDGSMNIIPYVGGKPYGKELHETLGEAQASIMNKFNIEAQAASKEIGAAKSALELQYQTGREQLGQQGSFISQEVAQQKEYKSLLKKKYAEKLADMKETILSMFGG